MSHIEFDLYALNGDLAIEELPQGNALACAACFPCASCNACTSCVSTQATIA
ncbi:thiocillin family RiPP [Sphaerisporangium album]|uniref:Thiocillin family RiPP n=1 Tax=Sphaerisporangium album TaxID=509200 RepID=A0A367FL43_9ACTN|nr:thiocillin family RiPP [Sphaerisporangium album]RCG30552.1 thiocillin family RiPP [Sphaerisporangium album]